MPWGCVDIANILILGILVCPGEHGALPRGPLPLEVHIHLDQLQPDR